MSLRKYPFLVDPVVYSNEILGKTRGLDDIAGEEPIISLAAKRIEYTVRGEPLPDYIGTTTEEEVFSFWLAFLALREAKSISLLDKMIKLEVDRVKRFLEKESLDNLIFIAKRMGVKVDIVELRIPWIIKGNKVYYRELNIAVNIADYLKYTAGTREERLKLINSFLLKGRVYMDTVLFKLFLLEAINRFILEKVKNIEPPEVPAFLKLVSNTREYEIREVRGIKEELFPNCILEIISKSRTAKISGEEAYVLLTFLNNIGAPREYIEDIIVRVGLAPRDKAKLIVGALDKLRDYTPFNCDELKARSICDCKGNLIEEYFRARRGQAHY
ncbi:MAG: hypothetical protein QXO93_04595 [Acidilobaceae archaeon]